MTPRPLVLVAVFLGCSGSGKTDSTDGPDVTSFQWCLRPEAPDVDLLRCDQGLTIEASDCLGLYSPDATNHIAIKPADCSTFFGEIRPSKIEEAIRSTTPCPSTGEVVKMVLSSGETMRKDIAGCNDPPYADLRGAIARFRAVLDATLPDAGGD